MEAAVAEIKPSIKKAFISNILIVAVIVFLIIGLLIYLNTIVGLRIFLDVFREIGIIISPAALLGYLIFIIVFITLLLLIMNYVTLSKMYFTLYRDKLVCSQSFFVAQLSEMVIPYGNITKVTYKKKPLFDTSTINIGLTGMEKEELQIHFVDNVEAVVREIDDLIRNYRANYYARYAQDYRMQNIMDKM